MNYLVVVAHPDDEVLGAGATIKKTYKGWPFSRHLHYVFRG